MIIEKIVLSFEFWIVKFSLIKINLWHHAFMPPAAKSAGKTAGNSVRIKNVLIPILSGEEGWFVGWFLCGDCKRSRKTEDVSMIILVILHTLSHKVSYKSLLYKATAFNI